MDFFIISILFFCFLILLYMIPTGFPFFIIFCLYLFDEELAKWGFFLAWQLLCYYLLLFFFKKQQKDKRIYFILIFLLIIHLLFCLFYYHHNFFVKEPLRLLALVSGACILYLCSGERTEQEFFIPFGIYFLISIFMGILTLVLIFLWMLKRTGLTDEPESREVG